MMKKSYILLGLLLVLLEVLTACKDMNDIYSEYVVPGGVIYTGKAASPVVYPGLNRVKVSWLRGVDPNVNKARIFWNNNTDSVEVSISPNNDTINVMISDLIEGFYSFFIRTYDNAGASSVPVEVSGSVYGENYQSSLINRPVLESMIDKGKVTIRWGNADILNGAVSSELRYVNTEGQTIIRKVPVDEDTTIFAGYDAVTESMEVRTVFVPFQAINDTTYIMSVDTFYTDYTDIMVSLDLTDLGGLLMTQDYGNSFAQSVSKLVDNDVRTKFLVRSSSAWVTFQQPNPSFVTGYALTSADDVPDRDPKNWTFQGSNDGISWVLLDSRTNITFANRLERKFFGIPANKESYTYYRINMTNRAGAIFQLAEMEIFGTGGGGYHPGYPEYNDYYTNSAPPRSYLPAGNLSLLAGSYLFDNAAIYKDANDKVHGLWAWRFAPGNSSDAYIQMDFDVNGAKKVSFWYAKWSDPHRTGAIKLEYSTNHGASWTQTGEIIEVTNSELQLATFDLNIEGSVRFRIVKLGRGVDSDINPNGIVNIDNFAIHNK